MVYNQVEYLTLLRHPKWIISQRSFQKSSVLSIRSTQDYIEEFRREYDDSHSFEIIGNEIFCKSIDQPYYEKISLLDFNIETFSKKGTLAYRWKQLYLNIDFESSSYFVSNRKNEIVFQFKPNSVYRYSWTNVGVLEYFNNEKTSNWIRCIDPNGGMELWRIDYPGYIVRCEQYNNLLILDYHTYNTRTDKGYEGQISWHKPNKYTLAIDAKSGKEVWKQKLGYDKIDRTNGVATSGGHKAVEIDLNSGEIKYEVKISPSDKFGYFLHFVDDTGIYYTNHYSSFGKISKMTGEIMWEFDLIDKEGKKRKLSEWLLLGNGKLVLQAMPNTGEPLMCVFDPEANLEESNIINGRKQ